jgi:hypothetical protein
MDFAAFKDWVALGLLTCGVYIFWALKQSVDLLNIQMAVMIEKISGHETRITKLEDKK